jgi:hypothetical protein
MVRAFAAFLALFSVLSLIVHLAWMSEFLGAFALLVFASDQIAGYVRAGERRSSVRREVSY